jgi:hypothetical protein
MEVVEKIRKLSVFMGGCSEARRKNQQGKKSARKRLARKKRHSLSAFSLCSIALTNNVC